MLIEPTLLLKILRTQPTDRLLLLEGGSGQLARQLEPLVPRGEILTLARDVREVTAANHLLTQSPNVHASDSVFPPPDQVWDQVILLIPKGRRYARTLLLAAWQALRPGGHLWLIGTKATGGDAVFTDAQRLFGNAAVIGYKKHQRIARSIRGEMLPDPLPPEFREPGIAPGLPYAMMVERPEGRLTLHTHPGIFSWDALDEGSKLLLDHLTVRPGSRVWDVGCGAGVIGLAAALAGASAVLLTDINLLAVRYAQENAIRNTLDKQVTVRAADNLTDGVGHWDLIVSNPAFHAGHQVDTAMADALIGQAPPLLAPGGRLLLVANRFLAYDKKMQQHFKMVTRVAETPHYHLLEAS
jgi:16S rRNA (guanine1207-N2)-methyltransferase